MFLEINLNVLKDEDISADDFTALYLIYKKEYDLFNSLNLRWNPEKLEEKGFIKLHGDTFTESVIRQEFLDLFLDDFERMFAELLATYPMKVMNNSTIRILHASNPKAKSNMKARLKYKRILEGKPYLHKYIIKCLDNQLNVMRTNLGFMQNLETWLNNHTWEKYQDIDINDRTQSEATRITRRL